MSQVDLNFRTKTIEKWIVSRCLFIEKDTLVACQMISKNDFIAYGDTFDFIVKCVTEGKDAMTEATLVNVKLAEFVDYPPKTIEELCKQLKELSNARKLKKILQESVENIPHENVQEFTSDVQRKILDSVAEITPQNSLVSLISEFRDKQAFYKNKFDQNGGIIGLSTGYEQLDNAIDGFRPEHLWVVGGYTNMGKTAASLNLAAELIRQGKRVVYYSLEMGSIDILARLLGIMVNDGGMTILKSYPHDEKLVAETLQKIESSNLKIHTNCYELSELLFSMYQENFTQKVDMFIIDFVQLITVKGARSEYEIITTAITEIQQMAKRLKTTIMALSQISNEGARANDQVVMSFKGSGAIAAASDIAIEITINEQDRDEWKKKMNNGEPVEMKWNIRKNRHGRIGFIDMFFTGRTGQFIAKNK